MKKCIVISDSFKGTLSSPEICGTARQSIPKFFPGCEVVDLPVADGGEGTVECFVQALQARPVTAEVKGPYGKTVQAIYCRSGKRAVIEMASAAGLPMAEGRLNQEKTTTYGVGEQIAHAVKYGCTEILLGLGGIGPGAEEAYDLGVSAIFGTDRPAMDFRKYPEPASVYYQRTLEDILRLIQAVQGGICHVEA